MDFSLNVTLKIRHWDFTNKNNRRAFSMIFLQYWSIKYSTIKQDIIMTYLRSNQSSNYMNSHEIYKAVARIWNVRMKGINEAPILTGAGHDSFKNNCSVSYMSAAAEYGLNLPESRTPVVIKSRSRRTCNWLNPRILRWHFDIFQVTCWLQQLVSTCWAQCWTSGHRLTRSSGVQYCLHELDRWASWCLVEER